MVPDQDSNPSHLRPSFNHMSSLIDTHIKEKIKNNNNNNNDNWEKNLDSVNHLLYTSVRNLQMTAAYHVGSTILYCQFCSSPRHR